MATEQQIDRSVLAGKDRDELHTIAGAIGVKAATRMRKADLIDAILAAANGGDAGRAPADDGDAPTPREAAPGALDARRRRPPTTTSPRSAAEENALGADAAADEPPMPRPRTRRRRGRAASRSPDARHRTERARQPIATPTTATTPHGRRRATTRADADSRRGRRRRCRLATATTTVGATASTPRTSASRSARATGAAAAGAAAAAARTSPAATAGPGEFQGEPIQVQGLLDLRHEGYGFLRGDGYLPAQKDVYVSASQVRRFALRKGDFVNGTSRPQASNEKYPALLRVDDINGMTPDDARARAALRGPHAAVPRREAPPRARRRPAARSPAASST